jgi:shikimate dehydrogenase
MQRAAFAAVGLDAFYEAIDVPPDRLATELNRLHRAGYSGLNLTAPLKEQALRHLIGATPEAERLRAVNTLVRREQGWYGDATDGAGFAAWAREAALPLTGASVALLGSGGAARAVAPYLGDLGARSVVVVARDLRRAVAVAEDQLRGVSRTKWSARQLSSGPHAEGFTLLVRALSPGELQPDEAPWWATLATGATVVDLNYGPLANASRARAAKKGLRFEDGRGMLLHQGAQAFERWTGRRAPVEAMRRALAEAVA